MKLRTLVPSICIVLCATNCGYRSADTSKAEDTPKLKALIGRYDMVLVKNFLGPQSTSDGRSERFLVPGFVSLEAMTVSEPGKESERTKGIRVDVGGAYVLQNEYSRRPEHVSLLDESEAHDMDAALTYMQSIETQWAKTPPSHHTEVMFRSKDDFTASLLRGDKGDSLFIESGPSAMVDIPIAKLPEFQSKLKDALQTLDRN